VYAGKEIGSFERSLIGMYSTVEYHNSLMSLHLLLLQGCGIFSAGFSSDVEKLEDIFVELPSVNGTRCSLILVPIAFFKFNILYSSLLLTKTHTVILNRHK
jgi:hypothetical protein